MWISEGWWQLMDWSIHSCPMPGSPTATTYNLSKGRDKRDPARTTRWPGDMVGVDSVNNHLHRHQRLYVSFTTWCQICIMYLMVSPTPSYPPPPTTSAVWLPPLHILYGNYHHLLHVLNGCPTHGLPPNTPHYVYFMAGSIHCLPPTPMCT